MKPTVYDIAKLLGISPSTVSRTLNGSTLVRSETQERVLEAARELGYSHRTIRRPTGRAILNVALFLPVTSARYAALFYDVRELIAGVKAGLDSVRANVVVDLAGATQVFEQKKLGDLHGALFAFCRPDAQTAAAIDARDLPIALINRIDRDRTSIVPDTEAGMVALVARARAAELHRLCFLGFQSAPEVSGVRENAFRAACAEVGVGLGSGSVRTVGDLSEITPALIREIHGDGFDACLCFNDVLAIRFLEAARLAGLEVPRDIGVAGFDDSPILDLATTRIDTVSLSTAELGRRAGEWLLSAVVERRTKITHERVAVAYVPGETLGGS